ncbi:MAG TPA: DNA polymerase IV [Jatrophihabitantaceae bacterium]
MGRSADIPRVSGQTDGDDTGCTILHVDMDAFFASVEIRNDPSLRGKPVVVGGGTRGVVAAASYEARKYGVHSAMPMTQALRLCPRAVVVRPDRAAYSAASAQVMQILRDVTPLVQPLSLDEAFLDVSQAVRGQGRPAVIAASIRERVEHDLALTCSVGVAPTKFVAKVASARCKPDGLLVVPVDDVLAFLHPMPVTVLWGVGARTGEQLRRLGIRTIGDVAATPIDALRRAVGDAMAEHVSALAAGVDPRPVTPGDVEKSISSDHTVERDLTEPAEVHRELLRLSADVGRRVRERGFRAHTVGIKIRFADFTTVTRVRTLPGWTDETRTIYDTAVALFDALGLDRHRIRLVGVKAENLREADEVAEQLSFDDLLPVSNGGRAPDGVIDAARERFGSAAIGYATLLRPPGSPYEPEHLPVPDEDR